MFFHQLHRDRAGGELLGPWDAGDEGQHQDERRYKCTRPMQLGGKFLRHVVQQCQQRGSGAATRHAAPPLRRFHRDNWRGYQDEDGSVPHRTQRSIRKEQDPQRFNQVPCPDQRDHGEQTSEQ